MAKTRVVSIEYVYQVPENLSTDQAREIALSRAKIQAIAEEFGQSINQINSTVIDTNNDTSTTHFLSLGGSELRGEWVEDIERPVFEYITDGSNIAIKVRIKGRVREIKGGKVNLDAKILRNGTSDINESDHFNSGDEMFVSIISPISGYLAIYLLDTEENAYCLLPYQEQNDGIFQVKANHKYLLFDPMSAEGIDKSKVDELILETDLLNEQNRVLIVFSPNKFYKGLDNKLNEELPRTMRGEDFRKWLSNQVKKDSEMLVSERVINITKR